MSNEQKAAKKRGRPRKSLATESRPSTWQDRLVLNPGESLRLTNRSTSGTLGQDDGEHYDVINAQGQVVGSVIHEAYTSLKPPCATRHRFVQKGLDGNVIVEVPW